MEKVIRDGKTAIIIHKGWGFPWSTGHGMPEESLFDPHLVHLLESNATQKEVEDYSFEKYKRNAWGSWNGHNLQVEWIDEGREFIITSYDGRVCLFFKDTANWIFP